MSTCSKAVAAHQVEPSSSQCTLFHLACSCCCLYASLFENMHMIDCRHANMPSKPQCNTAPLQQHPSVHHKQSTALTHTGDKCYQQQLLQDHDPYIIIYNLHCKWTDEPQECTKAAIHTCILQRIGQEPMAAAAVAASFIAVLIAVICCVFQLL